jgi:predicted acyl esterase
MFRTVNNIKVQQFQLPPTGPQHRCKLSKPAGGPRILQAGVVYFEGHAPLLTDILLEQDIPIPMRDGETIFADVYRPANTNEKVPAIICNGPYGKTWCSKGLDLNNFPWRFGCPKLATTGLETFEGLDPGYWCRHHYAIVHPGKFYQ